MSFRWFVYYCSLFGGCGAYAGWALGRLPTLDHSVIRESLKGLFLGMVLALVLTLVDALWNLSASRGLGAAWRVLVGGCVGGLGGLVGGGLGQVLYGRTQWALFLVLGWSLTGLLIGAAPGTFDLLASLMRDEDNRGARRKVVNGVLGGAIGGVLGGTLFLVLRGLWGLVLRERAEDFWSPSATGFVALGLCIGLLIGLAQVILKEAWVRVEVGFRAGRELILSRAETTIGRAESSDVGLFGDPSIERLHARIVLEDGRYLLEDAGTPGGTFLNGERISGPTPLSAGDEIGVGRSRLRFGERQKREEEP
jgi:FHA domain